MADANVNKTFGQTSPLKVHWLWVNDSNLLGKCFARM